ncbi:MAG: sulfatase-like hydrolase/transferase [Opitutales bacterium]
MRINHSFSTWLAICPTRRCSLRRNSEGGRFGDVIEEIEWSVGKVMEALKKQNIDQNTLVIFTSDNGAWTMFGPHGGTAAPLAGGEGDHLGEWVSCAGDLSLAR